jgi:hypothetical protein
MPKGTKLTRGIRRAKVKPGIIDKVKNAFNRPKTQQVQHKTPEQKVTTRQVVHKMPEADKFPDKTTKPKTTQVPITRTATPTPTTTTAPPPAMSRNQYRDNFRNDAVALMNAKEAHYARPEHMRNFANSPNLGEGLDRINLIYNPDRGDGTSYRHYDIAAIQDDGSARVTSFKDYDDPGIKDAINKAYTKYRDTNFIETDPLYQQFRANYGRRANQGQNENYINYNPNTNKFSLFNYSEKTNTNYFDDVDSLLYAGSKMSYRRNR